MTFTERHLPPPEPAGSTIPDGVRVSLLRWFEEHRVASPTQLWVGFCRREGYSDFNEIARELGRRFGDGVQQHFKRTMADHFERDKHRMVSGGKDYHAEPALLALPPQHFLDVLELAIGGMAGYEQEPAVQEINRLFAKRGIFYRFRHNGLAEWHGDEASYTLVVKPALVALADPRLAGARAEFETALQHLRSGSTKDLEDAIEEAAKAVESAMKVALGAHAVTLSGKETATPLFGRLVTARLADAAADQAVLAASRIRNAHGGHGSGSTPRNVPESVAQLALMSAAAATNYLAAILP